jgi:hypothetical protein
VSETNNLDRRIVETLLSHSRMTVPQLATALRSTKNVVDYHVKNLVERNILAVTWKKYGSLYTVAQRKVAVSKVVALEFGITSIFCMFGILSLLVRLLPEASVLLLISSIIGIVSAAENALREKREKIKTLLELVS